MWSGHASVCAPLILSFSFIPALSLTLPVPHPLTLSCSLSFLSTSLLLALSFPLFRSLSVFWSLSSAPFFSLSLPLSLFLLPSPSLFCLYSLEGLGLTLGQVTLGLFETLAGRFSLLCQLTGQHATSLTANLRRHRDLSSLLILDHAPLFLDSYLQSVHRMLISCSVCFHTTEVLPPCDPQWRQTWAYSASITRWLRHH